ncbi:MAG: hypothetical protein QXN26_02425 [Thermoplasmataceae archaeon]
MRILPREHGLIVTWSATLILGVSYPSMFHVYGLILLASMLPGISLYDTILASLREARSPEKKFPVILASRMKPVQWGIIALESVVLVFGIAAGYLPLLPVVIFVAAILAFSYTERFTSERGSLNRGASMMAITSQFPVISSAMTGSFTLQEAGYFCIFSAMNIILATGATAIVSARAHRVNFFHTWYAVEIPVVASAIIIVSLPGMLVPISITIMGTLLSAAAAGLLLMRKSGIKALGIYSSSWILITLVLITLLGKAQSLLK